MYVPYIALERMKIGVYEEPRMNGITYLLNFLINGIHDNYRLICRCRKQNTHKMLVYISENRWTMWIFGPNQSACTEDGELHFWIVRIPTKPSALFWRISDYHMIVDTQLRMSYITCTLAIENKHRRIITQCRLQEHCWCMLIQVARDSSYDQAKCVWTGQNESNLHFIVCFNFRAIFCWKLDQNWS